MKRTVLLVGLAVLAGCDPAPGDGSNSTISYTYDANTELCFAYTGFGNSSTLATVPCTDKVIKAIRRAKK